MAASVIYAYPNAGTVAPTASQAFAAPMQTATVAFADADTTATITHNWGLSAAALARLWPAVMPLPLTGGTPSPLVIYSLTSNTIVLTKQSTAAGSGGTISYVYFRHSLFMPVS